MSGGEDDVEQLGDEVASSLSAPRDPSFRTPSRGSRTSHRSRTPPGSTMSSGLSPMDRADKRSSRDFTRDENISILDPRRFTPTLHANLVSEILALRRDQEEKTKLIDSLEESLATTRDEKDELELELTSTAKESRSLKRQLTLLEGGTSSALGELSKERDEAVDSVAESKKRLDDALKKIKTQQHDSQRVHDLWAQEKDAWEDEKRKLERKFHVSEGRLKTVLDEVAAFQAAQAAGQHGAGGGRESDGEESVGDVDNRSIRSLARTNSLRFSSISGQGSIQLNGATLADELNFDDEDDDQTEMDDRESTYSRTTGSRHTRNFSRDSAITNLHRTNRSMESLNHREDAANRKPSMNATMLEALEGDDRIIASKVPYTDKGVQYSPPPSPKLPAVEFSKQEAAVDGPRGSELESSPRQKREMGAWVKEKRLHYEPPTIVEPSTPAQDMVSSESQTIAGPLSPPRTPELASSSPLRPEKTQPQMVNSGTQTVQPKETTLRQPSPPPLDVPSINIQPPTSRPTTPREPRLPQHLKDFGCQVNLPSSPWSVEEAGTQTEGIQVDKRIALLPAHLQPSTISSRPNSPSPEAAGDEPVRGRDSKRLAKERTSADVDSSRGQPERSTSHKDFYPGSNDEGPLSGKKAPTRRPHRVSSLFAGFETASSEGEEYGDGEMSDSEYRTALSAPRPLQPSGKSVKSDRAEATPTLVRHSVSKDHAAASAKAGEMETSYSASPEEKKKKKKQPDTGTSKVDKTDVTPTPASTDRNSIMRKSALIQSGITSHHARPRSPSLPDAQDPPFPIPARASSRQPSFRSGYYSSGRRSPTKGKSHRNSYRTSSVRKVRSAAALPRMGSHYRHGSRSPPPLSPSTEAPESPGLPPLPRNDLTNPRNLDRKGSSYKKHRHQLSANTTHTNATEAISTTSTSQMPGVVDAIAQTMVGEWMFKYVRRRKSFGVPDNSSSAKDNSNDRHKRWVWLAPYERAILWSSKQPSSGSALMGKSGRKLTIQSVLDVKDDNPAPKGTATIFNRSILILTPQRALKFTAPTAERHYIWLTALSFLAHSQQAVPELPNANALQPKKQTVPEFDAPKPKAKRPGIRDSIRLAKSKSGSKPEVPSAPSVPSIPGAPPSQLTDSAFQLPEDMGVLYTNHLREDSQDAAEPPYVPRFSERAHAAAAAAHGRKRSNTGGHIGPPLSFRGFSGPAIPGHHPSSSTAGASIDTAGSSELFPSQGSQTNTTWAMSQGTMSRRTSSASSPPANFFDAIGTMRMEAFISPLAPVAFQGQSDDRDDTDFLARRHSREKRRRYSRSRRESRGSFRWRGADGNYLTGPRTPSETDLSRDDPFRNF